MMPFDLEVIRSHLIKIFAILAPFYTVTKILESRNALCERILG